MGNKKEVSDFEKRIKKIRRSKNLTIFALIVLFFGLNGYVGYSVYSIYTVNDLQTQVMSNNATITITMDTNKLGDFVFDELGMTRIIGQSSMPFTDLMTVFGGSEENSSSNTENPAPAQDGGSESGMGPLGLLLNLSVFDPFMSMQNNTEFIAALDDTTILAQYGLTLADVAPIKNNSFRFADLYTKVMINMVLPITIQNPSFLNFDVGKIVVSLVGENNSTDLINYQFPVLTSKQTVTANLALNLNMSSDAVAAMFGGEGGDPMSAIFGGATKIQISLDTSLLYVYPISLTGVIDLAGIMGGGSENTDTNTETTNTA